jgi:predicted RND superfamily exporter protein
MLMMRRALAVSLFALGAVSLVSLRGLEVDNRLERWVGDDPEQTRSYREFRRSFGSDEFVLVAVEADELFGPETLDAMVDAAEAIEAVPGVRRVRGVPTVYRDLFGSEDPEALLDELTSTPFYSDLFISRDRRVAGILAEVEPADDSRARRRIVAGIRDGLIGLVDAGHRVEMVGSTVLSAALDETSEREARRSFPVALALSLGVLAVLLRSIRAMAVAAVCAGLTVVLTLGLMAAAGLTMNMISAALPSLLWVLALANCIHILRRYQDRREHLSTGEALLRALAETTRPCTLASITTALGFLSLVAATLQPVREAGVLAAIGLLLALAVNLTVGPTLIQLLRVPATHHRRRGRLDRLMPKSRAQAASVLVVAASVAVIAAISLRWVPVASNPLSFLPSTGRTVEAYSYVGGRIGGFYTLEVVVDLPTAWWSPDAMSVLDGLAEELDSSPIVARVLSPLDLLRKLNHWESGFDPAAYRLPPDGEAGERLLSRLDAEGRDLLATLADSGGRRVRLSAVVNEMDDGRFLSLVDRARSSLEALPAGFDGQVTGAVLRLVTAQRELVATQLRSFGLAFAVVFLSIRFGLGSWRLTAISVVPNVLPIMVSFAIMAMMRFPLDAATVMVASVALGIAVDDAVHFLEGYRWRRESLGVREALERTMTDVGPALVVTTVTACIGFFAVCNSAFVPIRYFGLLAGVAMVVALAADVVVVPAIMLLVASEEDPDHRPGWPT